MRKKKQYFTFNPKDVDTSKPLASNIDFQNAVEYARHLKQLAAVEEKKLMNARAKLDLDRQRGNLCYIDTAIEEFSAAISAMVALLRNLPTTIGRALNTTVEQQTIINGCIDSILLELSGVEVHLTTTNEIDAKEKNSNSESRVNHKTKKVDN